MLVCAITLPCLFVDGFKQTTQTKQGQKLSAILGLSEEVMRFDKARVQLKSSPNNSKLINQYLDILTIIKRILCQEQSNLKRQLKEKEHQYFTKFGRLPTTNNMLKDPTFKLLTNKLRYCKALVDQWKIENKKN